MDRDRRRDYGRAAANLAALVVGGTAGYLSWRHLWDLGLHSGLDVTSAALSAVPIDGMILVGTLQLRAARRANHPAHWSAYLCVIAGVTATVAGNIAAAPPNVWARILFAAPPIAFLLSIEALFGKPLTRNLWDILRRRGAAAAAPTEPAPVKPSLPPQPAPPTFPVPEPQDPLVIVEPAEPAERPERKPSGRQGIIDGRTVPVPQGATVVDGRVVGGGELREIGRKRYRFSVLGGTPYSQRGLAETFTPPMSQPWARDRISEVRAESEPRVNGHRPEVPVTP